MSGETVHSERGVISAEQALRFLDEASDILAGSLNYEHTVGTIAQLMVPVLADWCAVDVANADGTLRQITSGHPDPEQEQFLVELRRRYRAETRGSEGVLRVIETGEPELQPDVTGVAAARTTIHPDEADLYERLGPKSYVIVPLVARGRTIGALTLLSTRPGRHYTEADLDFAQHLSRRFALAIDNARLYDEAERNAAMLDTLFRSVPVGLAILDSELKVVRANDALGAISTRPGSDCVGCGPDALFGTV